MPSNREVERALGAELLEALRHQANTQTEWLERLAGQLVNHVLEVWSGTIGADGYIAREYGVAAGSVLVQNNSTTAGHNVTVSSGSPVGSDAPSGLGTWVIPPGACQVVPLASRELTIYGTADDTVGFQVFTSLVQPVASAAKLA